MSNFVLLKWHTLPSFELVETSFSGIATRSMLRVASVEYRIKRFEDTKLAFKVLFGEFASRAT